MTPEALRILWLRLEQETVAIDERAARLRQAWASMPSDLRALHHADLVRWARAGAVDTFVVALALVEELQAARAEGEVLRTRLDELEARVRALEL